MESRAFRRPACAACALLLAMAMPVWAASPAPERGHRAKPDPVVLLVGGRRIRASELRSAVDSIAEPPERQGFEKHPVRAAQWYGRLVALAQAAQRMDLHPAGLPPAPSVDRDNALISALMEHLARLSEPSASDEERYYERRPAEFTQARAQYILVSERDALNSRSRRSPAQARQRIQSVEQKLRRGASFAELAREFSDDASTCASAGDLGFVSPHQMTPTFDRVLWSLQPGETSPPFHTRFGWNILRVNQHRLLPFSEARKRIAGLLRARGVQARVDRIIARARIRPIPASLHSAF